MKEQKLFIPVVLGTNREGRQSEHVARWLLGEVGKRDLFDTELIDVRDYDLPHDAYGPAIKEQFSKYRDTILRADGLILVIPEYNHSFPGILKSVLDLLLYEYFHKAVGLVGVSRGVLGGARAIEGILPALRELGLVPIFKDLNIIQAPNVFNEKGELQDENYVGRAEKFFDELLWMAQVLKWGRKNISSEFRRPK